MENLSHLVPGLNNGESMSGGNTVAERPLSFGAPGSEPVDGPPDRFNQVAPVTPGRDDYAPIVGDGGGPESRPTQTAVSEPGESAFGWKLV